MPPLDPSTLPGNHRTRVFVGGSYRPTNRMILELIAQSVSSEGFVPILADQYALLQPELDVHDVTLYLLHACRLAVFDLPTFSGALMEIERCSDYGVAQSLVLYQEPFKRKWPQHASAWEASAMLKSLVLEHASRFKVRPYVRPQGAAGETRRFLRATRRSVYGKLHHL
jgi:hypothetical protein